VEQPIALHIANGVLAGPVLVAYTLVAGLGVALCVQRSRRDLDDRLTPMAGLVAAFVFAAQMLNFSVLPGVSGHLLGGTLAALLVGPWVGALCVTVVLVVQALVFADGGLTALGANITNMALVNTAAGYLVIVLLRRLLPRTGRGLAVIAVTASVTSVLTAALSFVVQYALGGATPLTGTGLATVALLMAGTHVLIGLGEGLITATTVTTVAKTRPDLVYALRPAPRAAAFAAAPVGSAA
jgi:cobalt/nickel transport system permease protein